MEKRSLRVIVASERPEMRYFLRGIVEQEGQTVIVGQAENGVKALALARNLRPDVVVVDCYLPHAVGLDTVALSRISGLDTAQKISEEIPNTKVILLRNLDKEVLAESSLGSGDVAFFSGGVTGANLPFTLHEQYHQMLSPSPLIFADIALKQPAAGQPKTAKVSSKTVLFAALGSLGVLFLVFAVTFGGGIFLALAGVAAMFLGLAGKLTASLRAKRRSQAKGGE